MDGWVGGGWERGEVGWEEDVCAAFQTSSNLPTYLPPATNPPVRPVDQPLPRQSGCDDRSHRKETNTSMKAIIVPEVEGAVTRELKVVL